MSASRERAAAVGRAKKSDAYDAEEEEEEGNSPSLAVPLPAVDHEDMRYYRRVSQYMLLCVFVSLLFAYRFERRLRGELVDMFSVQLDKASEAIFTERQKSQLEAELSSLDQSPCPVCGGGGGGAQQQSPLLSLSTSAVIDKGSTTTVQDVLDLWRSRNENLVEALTLMSRELLRVKYGSSPLYVRLNLQFPPSSSTASSGYASDDMLILLQLDGDTMPYSSLYFLEQVAAGAWDSCQFILNAGRSLQVDTRGDSCNRASFRKLPSVGESLAFQEFSPTLKMGDAHKRLTVGLSGRPAGPIFYVSLVNNAAALGPRVDATSGDMGPFGLPPEADPCFAKVVLGEDVVERINRMPVRVGDTQIRMLADFVTITSAKVVEEKDALKLIADCDPSTSIC